MTKICKICSKEFESNNKRREMCGSVECRREYQSQLWRKKQGAAVKKTKKNNNTKKIVDIAVEARKHGMSYGQYVAKLYLEGVR